MEDKITDYLKYRMPQAKYIRVTGAEKVPGGSSRETISFEAKWTESGSKIAKSFIIRRDPVASLLESDREMEFELLRRLESTPIPTPRMYWLELDEKWLERPFFIMEKMPGKSVPVLSRVRLFAPEDPELRARIAKQWVQVLAHIHTVDWKGLGLSFMGVPETGTDAATREIDRWEQVIEKHKLEPYPILTEALLWLKNNKPEAEQITLVHGDFKQDNFLFENKKITALLDWEMAHLGDPMEDLAWACCGFWRRDTPLMSGLIEKREFFKTYEDLSGIKVDEKRIFFYQVLACVKMAAIFVTGIRSFCDKRSHDIMARTSLLPLEHEMANLIGF